MMATIKVTTTPFTLDSSDLIFTRFTTGAFKLSKDAYIGPIE
jgi:hypothetical protein